MGRNQVFLDDLAIAELKTFALKNDIKLKNNQDVVDLGFKMAVSSIEILNPKQKVSLSKSFKDEQSKKSDN